MHRIAAKHKKNISGLSIASFVFYIYYVSEGVKWLQQEQYFRAIEKFLIGHGIYGLLQNASIAELNHAVISSMERENSGFYDFESNSGFRYLPLMTVTLRF